MIYSPSSKQTIIDNFQFINEFESALCNYTGFSYAVCVDCCTNAVLLSLEMLNRAHVIQKDNIVLNIPSRTYMSIPMTLKNNGWNIQLVDRKWEGFYEIGSTRVFDSATDFHSNMAEDYHKDSIVCISFQQKKRLALGRGGAILLNNYIQYKYLTRLRYDGRNARMSDKKEIETFPDNIICGYHCYMEPEKAAKGILLLNQSNLLPPYIKHTSEEYPDLLNLPVFKQDLS